MEKDLCILRKKDYTCDLLHSPYLQQGEMRCLPVIPGKRAMVRWKAYLGLEVVRARVLSAEHRVGGGEKSSWRWCGVTLNSFPVYQLEDII